jgi:hypothetical protein
MGFSKSHPRPRGARGSRRTDRRHLDRALAGDRRNDIFQDRPLPRTCGSGRGGRGRKAVRFTITSTVPKPVGRTHVSGAKWQSNRQVWPSCCRLDLQPTASLTEVPHPEKSHRRISPFRNCHAKLPPVVWRVWATASWRFSLKTHPPQYLLPNSPPFASQPRQKYLNSPTRLSCWGPCRD